MQLSLCHGPICFELLWVCTLPVKARPSSFELRATGCQLWRQLLVGMVVVIICEEKTKYCCLPRFVACIAYASMLTQQSGSYLVERRASGPVWSIPTHIDLTTHVQNARSGCGCARSSFVDHDARARQEIAIQTGGTARGGDFTDYTGPCSVTSTSLFDLSSPPGILSG